MIPAWDIQGWKRCNNDPHLPTHNTLGSKIVIGCNYHTTWQTHKKMRFVLVEVAGAKARLRTRNTLKDFWTNLDDLIFIETGHNRGKASELRGQLTKTK
jgi:hypothetical protein